MVWFYAEKKVFVDGRFFARFPYIFINYMEIRTTWPIRPKRRLTEQMPIKWFGHRIQYSVFEIDNSDRIKDNIITENTNLASNICR